MDMVDRPSQEGHPSEGHPSLHAVVRRASELRATTWDDPVRGRLRFTPLFDRAITPTSTLIAGVAELGHGDWLGVHRHRQAEVYHVIEGAGIVVVDGTEHEVSVGSSLFIPSDAAHGIRHSGGSLLRVLYTFAADSLDDVQYHWLDTSTVPSTDETARGPD